MQKSSDTLQNYFAIREERSKVKCRATGARDNNVLVLGSSLEHFVKHAKAVFTSSYVFFFFIIFYQPLHNLREAINQILREESE